MPAADLQLIKTGPAQFTAGAPLNGSYSIQTAFAALNSAATAWSLSPGILFTASDSTVVPEELEAKAAGPFRVDLAWAKRVGTHTGYVIERATGAGSEAWQALDVAAADASGYFNTELSPLACQPAMESDRHHAALGGDEFADAARELLRVLVSQLA